MIPISWAIALAVSLTSPVIMITLIPALLHLAMASFTPFLGGSYMATTPRRTGLDSRSL